MRIPYQQYWALRRLNRSLCRSDPHLAAMLAIFARLTVGEAIASREQPGPSASRMRRGLARLGRAMVAVAACLSACARQVVRAVSRACAAVRRGHSGSARTAMSIPPSAGNPGDAER